MSKSGDLAKRFAAAVPAAKQTSRSASTISGSIMLTPVGIVRAANTAYMEESSIIKDSAAIIKVEVVKPTSTPKIQKSDNKELLR